MAIAQGMIKNSYKIMPRKQTIKKNRVEDKALRIRGIILPADWDEQGNITAVSLSTTGEEEYRLFSEMKIGELLQLLRKNVEVVGYVGKEGKKKNITVETLNVIKSE